MSQWQNQPRPGFSVDPSVAPALRPSSSDRDYADLTLRMAHADGRLTDAELADRVERAESAWSLHDLSAVIADLTPPAGGTQVEGANLTALPVASMPPVVAMLDPVQRDRARVLGQGFVTWVVLAVLFNVLWMFTHGPGHYYWPIWPILATAVPLVGLAVARFGPDPAPPRHRIEPPAGLG